MGTVGVALAATTTYSDIGINNEYNFSISPALPAGLTINEFTGVITGTPTRETSQTDTAFTVRMDEEDTDWTSFVTITMTISSAPVATTTTTTVAPTTTTTVAVAKKTTIVCTKGSTVKRVTALNPKCPAGYKKKTK